MKKEFWQSALIKAKSERQLDATGLACEQTLLELLNRKTSPASAKHHASLELAELELNVFCNARSCAHYVAPIAKVPEFAERAQLTALIAELYDREITDRELTEKAKRFAKSYLDLSDKQQVRLPPASAFAVKQKAGAKRKLRIGLLSPLFSAGPLYYLSFETFKSLSREAELVMFSRAKKSDWATEEFKSIAKQWVDCAELPAEPLTQAIADTQIDVLFELGGWMDTEGLKAVSLKPASKIFKWVGGQAMTTGLNCFDGFLSDPWQTPPGSQSLYTEPLILLPGGYVRYTKPKDLPKPASRKDAAVAALIGNPLKVTEKTIDLLVKKPKKSAAASPDIKELRLIDRRYGHPRVLARVERLLERFRGEVTVIACQDHAEFLREISRPEWVMDTAPYSAGLTAREALAMGAKLLAASSDAKLFASRHGIAAQSAFAAQSKQKPESLASIFKRTLL